jgi:hypothetical protein
MHLGADRSEDTKQFTKLGNIVIMRNMNHIKITWNVAKMGM